jgi:hypothetical protein
VNAARTARSRVARPCIGLLAVALLLPAPSFGHVQTPRGRLVDVIQRSDVILIATIEASSELSPRLCDTTASVARVLRGGPITSTLSFRAPTGLATGQRYVMFLRREGTVFVSLAPSGTVFPVTPADDAAYEGAVNGIGAALTADESARVRALQAALVSALSAPSRELRYYAALDLAALDHGGHRLSDGERERLASLLRQDDTDPALQPLLGALVEGPR